MACSLTSLERSKEAKRRRKNPEPLPPAALDVPFGPPPAASLSRCAVCGPALRVHEALSEAGIGMAQFHKEYPQGFMPTLGCPGCDGSTMEYVDQEE